MSADTNDRKAPETPDLLAKTYEPHALERTIYAAWEQAGYFAPAAEGEPYCVMLPPPNVTGSLHMGHAFQHTLMDALIRYRRMRGASALWQGGTDHAGIATQMVVERQLAGEGKSRHDLGREPFLKRVWEWKAQSGGRITEQMRRLGTAVDWSRERFTMDAGLSRAVTEVFVRLHDEGLIYRGKRLVNWDPVLHTAVSDLEVVSEEEAGHLWHIKYPLANGAGHLVVATTRPETLLGDAAVAVHPEDERYRALIGQQVILPLTGRTIPVIADTYVDKEFGSGCVKITPAHDFNDYEVGKRHDLEAFNIFTVDAKIIGGPGDIEWAQKEHDYRAPIETGGTLIKRSYRSLTASDIPASYRGLDRFEARKRMVADLEAQGLIDKIEDHKLKVPRGDRTNAVIEPYLTDQWYVKIAPLAQPAIKAVEDGRIKFIPENWTKTYYDWMHNIQDWCISRQIWWGHRIPAWHDDEGKVYVGRSEDDVRAKYRLGARALRRDADVLDTWFSSALWPFSTLGWPEQTPELKKFYPTSVLVTGFDIIFFWVARMIMLGLKFMDAVPFHEVYVTGLVRDAEGQKMSKSKGNILDPLDLIDGIALDALLAKRTTGLMQPQMAKRIEQATRKQFPQGIPAFGTDSLRFTLASLATQGRDIKFDLGRIEGYRNFCNKLWNAARYVLMNADGRDCGLGDAPRSYTLAERWIWARTAQTVREFEQALAEYRFDLAAQAIYAFIWDEYCSWYLELSKVVLTDANADAAVARGTRYTLVQVLETALRLLHPLMPFITEAIWQKLAPLAGKAGASIMQQSFPRMEAAGDVGTDAGAIAEMAWVMQTITGVRNIRGEMDINPGKPLAALLQGGAQDRAYLERNRHYLIGLARLREIAWLDADTTAPEAATALVGQMKVLIPLAGLIDKDAELARLDKDIDALEKNLARERAKLSNQSFIERAPANVVAEAKARIAAFETQLAQLKGQRERVAAMAA